MVSTIKFLIADSDPSLLPFFSENLDLNFQSEFDQVYSAKELQLSLAKADFQILLINKDMWPGVSLADCIELVQDTCPGTFIVPIIEDDKPILVENVLQLKLYHYLKKPLDPLETTIALRRVREMLPVPVPANRYSPKPAKSYQGMIGTTRPMRQLFDLISRVAEDDLSTVLIRGESGTGKEMVAKAIHAGSQRCTNNFVPVNCAAIPDELLESELFGYTKGAFTGASTNKQGRIQYASEGTLFLDEIGDMKASLQAKLLRVLQEKEFEPVGSLQSIPVNTRIIAATHCDLEALVKEGKFREDLYYRLSVIPIHIPPLQERNEDIPLLIDTFLQKYTEERGRQPFRFSPTALAILKHYTWRGNVRELENLIQHMSILYSGKVVDAHDLPEKFQDVNIPDTTSYDPHAADTEGSAGNINHKVSPPLVQDVWERGQVDFKQLIHHFEVQLITKALQKSGGNKKEAARLLNLKRTTLLEKIKKKEIGNNWETE